MTQAVPLWWKIAHVWLAVDAQGVRKNVIRHVSDGRLKSHLWPVSLQWPVLVLLQWVLKKHSATDSVRIL